MIHLWSIDQDKIIHKFDKDCHTGEFFSHPSYSIGIVWQIVINKEGTTFFSCSDDQSIKVWDLKSRKLFKTHSKCHNSDIYCLSLTKEDQILISGSADKSIKIWNIEKDNIILLITFENAHQGILFYYISLPFLGYVWRIEPLSNQSNLFLTGDEYYNGDKSIKLWDITSQKQIKRFTSNTGNI